MAPNMIHRIISGFQTGADFGGIIAAKMHQIPTGGWMPKGFKTLRGNRPNYKELFDAQEHSSYNYKDRTWQNIADSTCTLRFAVDFNTAGEKCTLNGLKHHGKPYFDIQINKECPIISCKEVGKCVDFLKNTVAFNSFYIINVAGNAHDKWNGMRSFTTAFMSYVLFNLGYDRIQLCPEYWSLVDKA